MCKQSPFCMFSGLVFKAVFEKVKNLVTHTVIHIRRFSFLNSFATFLPPFFVVFPNL